MMKPKTKQQSIVEVYSAANTQQAFLVKAALADAGIEATVVGDMLQGAAGEVPLGWVSSPRLWVPQADVERARQVVADWETACAPDRPDTDLLPWTCDGCGAVVDGDFDVCWNCQRTRPSLPAGQ